MFKQATGEDRVRVSQADIDAFLAGIDPIVRAGKFGALLAQFPPSFTATGDNRDYLQWLLRRLGGLPVAVELRHRTWSDDSAGTSALLGDLGAAWALIDEPKFRSSIRQTFESGLQGFGYLRLHGRNAASWWRHAKSEDRYDYLYSAEELEPFAEAASAARGRVKKLYAYLNNHFAAKAVANAVTLKHQLGQPIAGEYPPEFLERYPEVASLVTRSLSRLSRTSS
jgi:uncharacterized protein YecE (DUF72 family)